MKGKGNHTVATGGKPKGTKHVTGSTSATRLGTNRTPKTKGGTSPR